MCKDKFLSALYYLSPWQNWKHVVGQIEHYPIKTKLDREQTNREQNGIFSGLAVDLTRFDFLLYCHNNNLLCRARANYSDEPPRKPLAVFFHQDRGESILLETACVHSYYL